MSFLGINAAQRRYNSRVLIAALAYGLLLTGERYMIQRTHVPAGTGYALAVLPALPIIAIFVLVARYLIEEQDEYLRMRMVRQILWATGITLTATTLWGFLEDAGLPHLPMFYVSVAWFAGLGVAGCILNLHDLTRRDR
jgi:hypothetical protein